MDESTEYWADFVLFRPVWVNAEARCTEVDPLQVVDFIKHEFDTVAAVRLDESEVGGNRAVSRATVCQLEATCPYCAESQLLHGGRWLEALDWISGIESAKAEESAAARHFSRQLALEQKAKELTASLFMPLDWWLYLKEAEKAQKDTGNVRELLGSIKEPEYLCAQDEEAEAVNYYKVDLRAIAELNPVQLGFSPSDFGTRSHFFGTSELAGGVYRCACCGEVFAVIYQMPPEFDQPDWPSIAPFYQEVFDLLLARSEAGNAFPLDIAVRIEFGGLSIDAYPADVYPGSEDDAINNDAPF